MAKAEVDKIYIVRLAKEYLSKVQCCDECFCEHWCIENDVKKSRVPYKGCELNIIKHITEMSTI